MDGVSLFVNNLLLGFFGLAAAFVGIIAMSVSLVLNFSQKQINLSVPVLAVIGTVLLAPTAVELIAGSVGLAEKGIVLCIVHLALSALVIVYDVIVIVKFIKQKKNKPTEEQQNG